MPFITPFFSDGSVAEEFSAKFLKHWENLALSTNQADPSCCAPAWNIAFHKIFHPGERIFYLEDSNSCIIFCESAYRDRPMLIPMEDHWLFSQPLLGNSAIDLLEDAILQYRDLTNITPYFLLSGIQHKTFNTMQLYKRFSASFNFLALQEYTVMGHASLKDGVDGWLSRRSANCRAKLKKAQKKSKSSGIWFERIIPSSYDDAERIYQRILSVESKSWKGLQHCGILESPSKEFYHELMQQLGPRCRVIFAKFGTQDIGFIFGSLNGAFYRGQQFSFDQFYANLSLGNLMQYEKITWLCEDNCQRYDMGPISGEKMAYKSHWTELATDIYTWVMIPKKD